MTLVELLIATVLLALILLSIVPLFITSVKANYSANEYTSIQNVARDKLEQLMSLPFNDAQLYLNAATNNGITDLPDRLVDPRTGVASATSTRNPLIVTYTVALFTETAPLNRGDVWVFNPQLDPRGPYDFKQVDVTVTSVSDRTTFPYSKMGIGNRTARVTGFIRNPNPAVGDPVP